MNMIIRAVLDAQINLALSHITMSVPGCTTFFLSGDMLQFCHREITFYTTLVTRLFLRSLQYGIVVMGFLDAFCLCPSSVPRLRESWKLW